MGRFGSISASLVVAVLALGLSAVPADAALFGVTFDEQLITINTSTGQGTLVGALDTDMNAFGLASSGGKLYTFDQTADLVRQLNPNTGATVASINVGLSVVGEGGFTLRNNGTGFLSSASGGVGQLFSLDIGAGTSAAITGPGGLSPSMDGLDLGPADVLFGISQISAALYTINQATGATTLIGDTGFDDANNLSGLAFADGVLFGEINGNLVTIDPLTGVATIIGPIGFSQISGLTSLEEDGVPPPGVPAPAAILLLGLGMTALAMASRRRSG